MTNQEKLQRGQDEVNYEIKGKEDVVFQVLAAVLLFFTAGAIYWSVREGRRRYYYKQADRNIRTGISACYGIFEEPFTTWFIRKEHGYRNELSYG